MNTRRTALSVAAGGTAAGIVGLVVLASPAGAGEPPALPPISAEALVESVLNAEPPAMSGSVEIQENLGLPIPIIPQLGGGDGARVYSDGQGRVRLALADEHSEKTVVADGANVWVWDSADRSVLKVPHDTNQSQKLPDGQLADPATAAKELVAAMQEDSTVIVDGTARVAGRPAYQLVLTPKPAERTLLREVRVAVDSELRVPLQLEVLANGQADPALKVGFTEVSVGAQDPSLFQFTAPQGAEVTEVKPGEHLDGKTPQELFAQLDAQSVGKGWDVVAVAKIPAELAALANSVPSQDGEARPDPMALLRQFGKQVSGPFGTGWVVTTKVGTALITEDGRVALGAVPEQVLVEALGQVK